jgi:hypothetical protein
VDLSLTAADKRCVTVFSLSSIIALSSKRIVDCSFAYRSSRGQGSLVSTTVSFVVSSLAFIKDIPYFVILIECISRRVHFFFLEVTCSGNVGMLCVFDFAFSCTRIAVRYPTTDPVLLLPSSTSASTLVHSTEARDRQTFWQTCPMP